jgi:hypothetical protein
MRRLGPTRLFSLSLVALAACNAIAGIGVPILESPDGSPTTVEPDAEAFPDGHAREDSGGPSPDDGSVPDSNVPDTNVPDTFTPPPAAAAKPGFDLTATGTFGASASYKLISVAGESPGGNNVGSSQHYVLKAGVIATTQPN